MEYLIGLDIGTSSVKGVLLSVDGDVLCCKTKKHNYYLKEGFKLLDADEFVNSCLVVISELNSIISDNDEIVSVCSSGASGNLVFVKDGKAVSPVYGWQNNFDETVTEKVLGEIGKEDVYKTVGWPKLKSFPLTALAYMKQTNPDLIESSDTICMHIEYLNYVMTGKWGITDSMGTPFYLINQEKAEYEKKYLKLLGIKESQLPPIMEKVSVLGGINDFTSQKTGLKKGTPVVLGTFDHPSAARGAGVFDENQILISCGTSWVVFIPFDDRNKPQSKKILTDPFMAPKGNWCGMKSLSSVADTIDGYIKKYLGDITYEQLDMLAEQSVLGANGLEIGDDTDVSGYGKSDIARAIMESIAKRLDKFLKELDVTAKDIRLVGGISKSNVWKKVISEVTGKNVSVVNGEHAGAVGSALMAGTGIGVYKNEIEGFQKLCNKEDL